MKKEILKIERTTKSKNPKKSRADFLYLIIPYASLLIILIIFPTLLILGRSFSIGSNTGLINRIGLDNYIYYFTRPEYNKVMFYSIWIAFITTVITMIIAYPAAYFISRLKERTANTMILIITIPMWINMLLRIFAWKYILDENNIIYNIIKAVSGAEVHLLGTDFAIILGLTYIFLPFMIIPIHTVLQKIDRSLIEAGRDLGGTRLKTFLKVTLPLSLPGVLSGITMVFLPAATNIEVFQYLGEAKQNIGLLIDKGFNSTGNWGLFSAISIVLSIIIMIMVFFVNKLEKRLGDNENE